MLLTRNLKSLLKNYEATLPAQDFASFMTYIEAMISKTVADLRAYAPGAERGRRVHELLEIEIQKASSVKSTCRAGCAACCHFEVEITSDEAEILSELVASGEKAIDQVALFAQAARSSQDALWAEGRTRENKCVFLSAENQCGVYENRPSSCRRLLVTTPPSECFDANGAPIPIAIPLAEVVLSAAIGSHDNTFGPLAQMVGKRLIEKRALEVAKASIVDPPAFTPTRPIEL